MFITIEAICRPFEDKIRRAFGVVDGIAFQAKENWDFGGDHCSWTVVVSERELTAGQKIRVGKAIHEFQRRQVS